MTTAHSEDLSLSPVAATLHSSFLCPRCVTLSAAFCCHSAQTDLTSCEFSSLMLSNSHPVWIIDDVWRLLVITVLFKKRHRALGWWWVDSCSVSGSASWWLRWEARWNFSCTVTDALTAAASPHLTKRRQIKEETSAGWEDPEKSLTLGMKPLLFISSQNQQHEKLQQRYHHTTKCSTRQRFPTRVYFCRHRGMCKGEWMIQWMWARINSRWDAGLRLIFVDLQ